jgi:ribosome-binding factor A
MPFMGSIRVQKVAAQVQQELSDLISHHMKDPRIAFASVTAVEMSPDLRSATVRVSVLGSEEERKATMAALAHGRGFLRHELAVRLSNLRFAPELRFMADESIAYSVRVSKLLHELLPRQERQG